MLDVGCAFGYLLKRAEHYFDQAVGVDLSQFALLRAREEAPQKARYPEQLVLSDERLPFPQSSFDFISALDVLEHTPSLKKSFQWMQTHLKPGGILMATMPLADTLGGRVFSWFDKDQSHISIPTQQELSKILDESGFNIVEQDYSFSFALGPLVVKSSKINSGVQLVLQKPSL